MSGDAAFAGRRRELATVVDVMTSSRRALTVTGEPGIGKSRLVMEAAAAVAERGVVVLPGQCLPLAANLPLLPFLDVLRALADLDGGRVWSALLESCSSSVRREVVRLLPDSADRERPTLDRPSEGDWQRERLFDAVYRVLSTAAERHGVAVVLEDLHWADQGTVDLLEYLLSPAHAVSAPIVLTYRTDDPVAPHETWLGRLLRMQAMSVLTLAPLDFPEAAAQVRSLAGGELPMADVQTLFERSDGNPFFIEQLVQSQLERSEAGSVGRLPRGLTSLLMSRIEHVAGPAREVMACLAVAERGVDEAFLVQCCAHPEPVVRQALRDLADRRLLRPGPDRGLRLAHALLNEAIAESMLPGELREWHQRIAEVMARSADTGAAAAVAEHFRAAGLEAEELEWRVTAAERSEAVFARSEAAVHWLRAIALMESLRRAPVLAGRTSAQMYASAARCLKVAGDRGQATALAQRGLATLDENPDLSERALLLAQFCHDPISGDDLQVVRDALGQAVKIYERLPPTAEYLFAAHDLWTSYRTSSHPESAVAALDRALALAPELDAPLPHLLLLIDRAMVNVQHGDLDAALDKLSQSTRLLIVIEDPLPHVGHAAALTDILLKLGRLEDVYAAVTGLDLTCVDPIRRDPQTSIVRLNVFEALTELGDVQGAAEVIDPVTVGTPEPHNWFSYVARAKLEMLRGNLSEAEARWAALPRSADPADACELEPWRLELKLWQRQPREALVRALDILRGLVDSSDTRLTGQLLLIAVRALADLNRWPTSPNSQPSTQDAAVTLMALHSGMADDPLRLGPLRPTGDADGLLWRAEWARAHHEAEAALWAAAAGAYEQHRRPHVVAYARWREAEALLLEEGRARATPVLQHAARLAVQHVPLSTAIATLATRAHIRLGDSASQRDAAVPHPFGLTAREMTVLELLCHGDTNAKIGSQLFISEKTASVHVTNILRKLDVNSRVEAAAIAEQLELLEPAGFLGTDRNAEGRVEYRAVEVRHGSATT